MQRVPEVGSSHITWTSDFSVNLFSARRSTIPHTLSTGENIHLTGWAVVHPKSVKSVKSEDQYKFQLITNKNNYRTVKKATKDYE